MSTKSTEHCVSFGFHETLFAANAEAVGRPRGYTGLWTEDGDARSSLVIPSRSFHFIHLNKKEREEKLESYPRKNRTSQIKFAEKNHRLRLRGLLLPLS
jgi:hypothetical protein